MARLVVVLPLQPLVNGDGFPLARWPLHLTVAPTFVIEADLTAVVAAVEPVLRGVPVLRVTAGPDEGFGRSGAIPVTVIEPSPVLSGLHRALHTAIGDIGGEFDDPEFVGDGYRAHVTMTKTARVHPGDRLDLRQATIVNMEPIGAQRLRHVIWAHDLLPTDHGHRSPGPGHRSDARE